MTFTDMSCGIEQPHRHTGEIVESHYIQKYCPFLSKWLEKEELCECTEPHLTWRTQTTTTEIIEILELVHHELEALVWNEVSKVITKLFLEGDHD